MFTDDIDVTGSPVSDDADDQYGLDTTGDDICGIASEILVISSSL